MSLNITEIALERKPMPAGRGAGVSVPILMMLRINVILPPASRIRIPASIALLVGTTPVWSLRRPGFIA